MIYELNHIVYQTQAMEGRYNSILNLGVNMYNIALFFSNFYFVSFHRYGL